MDETGVAASPIAARARASIPTMVLDRSALALGSMLLLGHVVLAAMDPTKYQFDLSVYYDAARSISPDQLGRLYPPYRPLLLLPLGLLPPLGAYYLFLFLKTLALAAVLALMAARVPVTQVGRFVLFASLAFNFSLGLDIRAGNVAILELLLLLSGFAALARDRIGRATVFILGGGLFKILPLALLGTILLSQRRSRTAVFAAGVGIAVVALLLPLAFFPDLVTGAGLIADRFDAMRGPIDSSLLALIQDIVAHSGVKARLGSTLCRSIAFGIYFLIVLVLIRASVPIGKPGPASSDQWNLALYWSLVFLVCAPRLVTYSLCLAILPMWLLPRRGSPKVRIALLIAACIPTQQILHRGMGLAADAPMTSWWLLPFEYWNWLVLLAAWLHVRRTGMPSSPSMPASLAAGGKVGFPRATDGDFSQQPTTRDEMIETLRSSEECRPA